MAVVASTTLEAVSPTVVVEVAAPVEEVAMTSSKVEEVEAGGKLTTTLPTACICARQCQ